ncbi:MAG: hypothetical protein HOC05_20700, partial [Gemmatimonadetes bacterium]|nr:hypothetical protein [Gemmatimonadota bacterium]
ATLAIDFGSIPIMAEALDMYQKGVTTGVNAANHEQIDASIRFDRDLSLAEQEILVDPQTSGGLLVALPASEGEAAIAALKAAGVSAACQVGVVEPRDADTALAIR